MRSAASRAATTMTTHSTAERTLLRLGASLSGRGSPGGRSAGGAVVGGGDGSIGEPRVQPGYWKPSASLRPVTVEKPAGGAPASVGQRRIARLGNSAVRAQP